MERRLLKITSMIQNHFISNPDNLPQVDHINHVRVDNRIHNLRWVSASDNLKNRTSNKGIKYEFVEELPEGAFHVTYYGKHKLEPGIYYADNKFYRYDGLNEYRLLYVNETDNGYKFVYVFNKSKQRIKLCYIKFKKDYGLL